jgi:excisionase family DNA binding protein
MKLLTAKEVADMIGCSAKTIYSWAETGLTEIPVIKIGTGRKSLLRFDPDEIREWLEQWKSRSRVKNSSLNCYNSIAETVAEPRKGADHK